MVSGTMASVTELFGKFKAPETYRLVVVAEVTVRPVKTVVEEKVMVPAINCIIGVPVTEVALL